MFHHSLKPLSKCLSRIAQFRRRGIVLLLAILACLIAGTTNQLCCSADETSENSASAPDSLRMLVMDPLSKPLACACVQGYAQRDYDKLGEFLEERLGIDVEVVFGESLTEALERHGVIDLVVGKDSVIRYDAAKAKCHYQQIAALTGKDDSTTFTGLFVVPAGDPAKKLSDLAGYRILFGPSYAIEKHGAAIVALEKALGETVKVTEDNVRGSCAQSAIEAIEAKDETPPTAGVISSYAAALLEGCGTIDPGSIRVIAKTEPVPFITVYLDSKLDKTTKKNIRKALSKVAGDSELCMALESKSGFVATKKNKSNGPKANKKKRRDKELTSTDSDENETSAAWMQWRGPGRDGIVRTGLPDLLADPLPIIWKTEMTNLALAGIVATDSHVIVADRDAHDIEDIFRCLDAKTGRVLWEFKYLATGELDYGNSPRSTPLIHDGRVYTLGAFGHFHCLSLEDGKVLWSKNLVTDYGAEKPSWGYSASPMIVDNRLILMPGGKNASIVSLDPATGKEQWKTPGRQTAYASPIVGTFGGVRQIVVYDATTLGGWDIETGRRLWELEPIDRGDFNVPTPVDLGDGCLLVTSENNGTRIYEFDDRGVIKPDMIGENFDLAPDSNTPVITRGLALGVWVGLHALTIGGDDPLETKWTDDHEAFDDYASIVADRDGRALITAWDGRLLLVKLGQSDDEPYKIVSEVATLPEGSETLSHPAIVGDRIYLRGPRAVYCFKLFDKTEAAK